MTRTGMFCLVEVELRGLEPLTPCLQRSLAGCLTWSTTGEVSCGVPMGDHGSPLIIVRSGTVRARMAQAKILNLCARRPRTV
jgi:hypothetical protein